MPGRAKLSELQGAVEQLEDVVCARHSDSRMASLEALLAEDLEKQRSRLDTHQKLREEMVLYAEARGFTAAKPGNTAKPRTDTSRGPHGGWRLCFNCGKKGHQATIRHPTGMQR
eukprot:5228414-Amphidinium_carterae.1